MIRLFPSCTSNTSFTPEEMRFTDPFNDTSIIVYKSALGQIDSIKFFKWELDTIKYRNFSQGFYNENILRVKYQLLNHSYHKINYGGGLSNYELMDNYLSFLKSKNGHSDKEINFLGLEFDKDYVNKILNIKESSIIFSDENARYKGVNINQGIKSFKFDFEKGITSFVDKNGVQWVRSN
ncbi:MAG TPA: hypothetical protein VMT76_00745 [Puia sp.]|nr:hypothetical protein [Puia sp.]